MDIELGKESQAQFDKIAIISLVKLVAGHDFSTKKSAYWLNKLKNRERCYHQLESKFSQISNIEAKINFLLLLGQLQAQISNGQSQTEQRVMRIFAMVCEVRWQIDSKGEENEETLMKLSKILKMANGLIDYLKLLSPTYTLQMEQCSFYEKKTRILLEKEAGFPFKLMISHLFRIKLLLYTLEASRVSATFQNALKSQIINSLVFITNSTNEYGQIIEQIFLNTYIVCLRSIRNFQQDLGVHFISLIKKFSNKSKLQLIYQIKSYSLSDLSNIMCQTSLQYQYFSQIIQDYSPQLHSQGKEELAQLWLKNLINLLRNEIIVDILLNSADFQKELAYSIYFKLDAYCKGCENDPSKQFDRKIGIYIWSSFILNNYMFQIILENKSIHLSSQVMFFNCLREIVETIPNTLSTNIQTKVLQAYSKYFGSMLLQAECDQLNEQIIMYLIHNNCQLISEGMIKLKNIKGPINKDYINIQQYNQVYLQEMTKVLIQGNSLKIPFESLQKKVGKVFFKFIMHKNIISVPALFSQLSVISYTIENDIEIHNDKVEHIIQQSIYTNINEYIGLLLKSHSKNRYRAYIDSCLINLLMNELQSSSNRKIITITENILIYFVRNSYSLFNYAQTMQIKNETYVKALYSFISRGLYFNFAFLSYCLLITAITLKSSFYVEYLDTEMKLIVQLTKFVKMYQNHREFSRIGFTCLLITIHGLPIAVQYKRSQEIDLHIEQNKYFMNFLAQFLSNQIKQTERACPLKENLMQFKSFHIILEKCFNLALNRHLLSIFQKSNHYVKQVLLLFGYLQDLLDMEFNQTKVKKIEDNFDGFIDKKRVALKKYNEKQVQREDENYDHEMSVETGFIEKYLAYYYSFNEFEEYKSLEEILPIEDRRKLKKGLKVAECDRVHGKIRKILHISK